MPKLHLHLNFGRFCQPVPNNVVIEINAYLPTRINDVKVGQDVLHTGHKLIVWDSLQVSISRVVPCNEFMRFETKSMAIRPT